MILTYAEANLVAGGVAGARFRGGGQESGLTLQSGLTLDRGR